MSTTEAVKGALQKSGGATSLQDLIRKSALELGQALPDHMRPERLVRIALTCVRLNPELSKCTPDSFLGSLFTAAQIGLEPVGGRSFLLPFRNKKKVNGEWTTVLECQFLIGFKGLIELFYRHASSVSIDMQTVHEKDTFAYQYGTESYLRHTPAIKDRGEVIGYYAVAKIKGGGTVFYFLSKEDALAHGKKHSKTYDKEKDEFYSSSPWSKEFDAMAMKTAIIQLAKKLPLSVELQRAIQADETSRNWRSGIEDALDITPTNNWAEESPVAEKAEAAAKVPAAKEDAPGQAQEPKAAQDAPNGVLTATMKIGSVAKTGKPEKPVFVLRSDPEEDKYMTEDKSVAEWSKEHIGKGSVLVKYKTVGKDRWLLQIEKA